MKNKGVKGPASAKNFNEIFSRLKTILQKHSRSLTVTIDAADHYCLNIDISPKFGKGFPVMWITTGKRYVSFHFMPVYMFPQLKEELSTALRARMQGKACFNFVANDEILFRELEKLMDRGLRLTKEKGITSQGAGGSPR